MPVISQTRYGTAQDAMTKAQALLNDLAGTTYVQIALGGSPPPTVPAGKVNLFPYLQMAIDDLTATLRDNGVSEARVTVQIELPLGSGGLTTTELSDSSSPQLPTDCVVPLKMWEQPTGSGDVFVPMVKLDNLPNLQPGSQLNFWQWQDGQINLIGANQNITVQIEYDSDLTNGIPMPTLLTDALPLIASAKTLAAGCAAYAAFADAGKTADTDGMFAIFNDGLDKIARRYVKAGQWKPRRRRPYGLRRRIVYL